MIPALKAVVAHYARDPAWTTVRPPLVALAKEQAAKVVQDLENLDFQMPGLRKETAAA
jgi:4-hydroxy-tetrahydrodipicolinate synthase